MLLEGSFVQGADPGLQLTPAFISILQTFCNFEKLFPLFLLQVLAEGFQKFGRILRDRNCPSVVLEPSRLASGIPLTSTVKLFCHNWYISARLCYFVVPWQIWQAPNHIPCGYVRVMNNVRTLYSTTYCKWGQKMFYSNGPWSSWRDKGRETWPSSQPQGWQSPSWILTNKIPVSFFQIVFKSSFIFC